MARKLRDLMLLQGVTKRCRLSWLTNSALEFERRVGGGGLRGLSEWVRLCTWSPNKLVSCHTKTGFGSYKNTAKEFNHGTFLKGLWVEPGPHCPRWTERQLSGCHFCTEPLFITRKGNDCLQRFLADCDALIQNEEINIRKEWVTKFYVRIGFSFYEEVRECYSYKRNLHLIPSKFPHFVINVSNG